MLHKISVIIPAYNHADYIEEAIDSVLSQTWPIIEVIVIDDGSKDKTGEVVSRYGDKVRYYYQENKGLGATRNVGASYATGDLIAFLDADDYWEPNKLEKQWHSLIEDASLDMVFTHVKQFHSPELTQQRKSELLGDGKILSGIVAGTCLCWKRSFDQVGAFPEHITLGEFMDWFARAKDKGLTHKVLPEIMLHRRLHNFNTSAMLKHQRSQYLQVIKAAMNRRRELVD